MVLNCHGTLAFIIKYSASIFSFCASSIHIQVGLLGPLNKNTHTYIHTHSGETGFSIYTFSSRFK